MTTVDRDETQTTPRPRPCSSCPYRLDAPSGLWHPDEYAKLPGYDGETFEQSPRPFLCHHDADRPDPHLCAGWLACHDPTQLLAVRLGVINGRLDESVLDYTTDVPVHPSGAAAAAAGMADIAHPSPAATAAAAKVTRSRTTLH